MPKKCVDVLVIALNSPIRVGIYENQKLLKEIESFEKSSDVLALLFEEILQEYELKALFYANGPGSFMAIKVAYIFLKSLSILKKVPLYARDAFYFNGNRPIKALGKLCFVKIADNTQTQKFDTVPEVRFELPKELDYNEFSNIATPLYEIGAVG
jgi:tRNA A37 threonylcarbamoyladenosine modification protein TsaB